MLTVTSYPASKWVTYYVMEEFIQKSQTEKEIKLFVFIYKKWIKNLTLSSHTLFQMDQIFYNCNIFMFYMLFLGNINIMHFLINHIPQIGLK
mmetsp:Transcript_10442/g.14567  ORF Transcript_10442/g.14567 Transcript_10442/m.14567 type:complete len:92 (-) Transcript_10442:453-728(-)